MLSLLPWECPRYDTQQGGKRCSLSPSFPSPQAMAKHRGRTKHVGTSQPPSSPAYPQCHLQLSLWNVLILTPRCSHPIPANSPSVPLSCSRAGCSSPTWLLLGNHITPEHPHSLLGHPSRYITSILLLCRLLPLLEGPITYWYLSQNMPSKEGPSNCKIS